MPENVLEETGEQETTKGTVHGTGANRMEGDEVRT